MRDLSNLSHEQAESNGWKVLIPLNCEVVGKAVYEDDDMAIMKTTKRFRVPGGWMYNTTTEVWCNGVPAVAEALAFVPMTSTVETHEVSPVSV